jgi:caa(3)-type oxidase subunit IV
MSTPTDSPEATATSEAHDAHEHPSDMVYVWIALMLAAFTAVEIALYYIDVGGAEIPALLTLMVVKFAVVAMYFMHLKFDGKVSWRSASTSRRCPPSPSGRRRHGMPSAGGD